jgi:hypothetical protein
MFHAEFRRFLQAFYCKLRDNGGLCCPFAKVLSVSAGAISCNFIFDRINFPFCVATSGIVDAILSRLQAPEIFHLFITTFLGGEGSVLQQDLGLGYRRGFGNMLPVF